MLVKLYLTVTMVNVRQIWVQPENPRTLRAAFSKLRPRSVPWVPFLGRIEWIPFLHSILVCFKSCPGTIPSPYKNVFGWIGTIPGS